jgi:hypothetical protein
MLFARESVVLCVAERRVRPTSLCFRFRRDPDRVKIPVQVPVRTTNFDGKGRLGPAIHGVVRRRLRPCEHVNL